MNERKENNLWCPECKELSQKNFKREPLCERCWPGLLSGNSDAWEVFLMARMDEMGMTVSGVEASCRILGVNDQIECCMKVRELLSFAHEIEKKNEPKPMNSDVEIPKGKW